MTKKKWIIIGIVALLLLLLCIRTSVFSNSVDQIVLKTYSHSSTPGNTEVVLNRSETWNAILLWNLGLVGGGITGEPCCASYWLEVCFTDGSQIRIAEGNNNDKMIITPVSGERYYIRSKALINFIHELIERYNMVCD